MNRAQYPRAPSSALCRAVRRVARSSSLRSVALIRPQCHLGPMTRAIHPANPSTCLRCQLRCRGAQAATCSPPPAGSRRAHPPSVHKVHSSSSSCTPSTPPRRVGQPKPSDVVQEEATCADCCGLHRSAGKNQWSLQLTRWPFPAASGALLLPEQLAWPQRNGHSLDSD